MCDALFTCNRDLGFGFGVIGQTNFIFDFIFSSFFLLNKKPGTGPVPGLGAVTRPVPGSIPHPGSRPDPVRADFSATSKLEVGI